MTAHTVTEHEREQSDTRGTGPGDLTPVAAAAPSAAFFAGNPAALGVPVFVAGSVALGLVLLGYVSAAAFGASIPIIGAATGLGLAVATVWSTRRIATLSPTIWRSFLNSMTSRLRASFSFLSRTSFSAWSTASSSSWPTCGT